MEKIIRSLDMKAVSKLCIKEDCSQRIIFCPKCNWQGEACDECPECGFPIWRYLMET